MIRYLIVTAILLGGAAPIAGNAQSAQADTPTLVQPDKAKTKGRFVKAVLAKVGIIPKPPVKVSFNRAWIDAQPEAKGDEQWSCLSEALYFEARGETVKGQFAVAEVIMNRVKSSRFPETLCGVVNQGTASGRKYQCQFTYNCDGYKNVVAERQAFERVSKVARAIIDQAEGTGSLTGGATHYHTTAVRPAWSRTYKQTARIGVHLFYRHNYRTAKND
ncbi:MAG: cell wall hydrolase [Rhodobacteraceae bacterium]|nr:cell wall hydrolase [Paracoccaceae bacterium]